jgi:hypothetical protein
MRLKKELLTRFELDQKLSKGKNLDKIRDVYHKNTLWLKNIIDRIGWPSYKLVGITGEQAAWLIAQHSPDLIFQEKCLNLIKNLSQTKERKEYLAYLTDSIFVKRKKKQIYGTQFYREKNGRLKPKPIFDIRNLEKRRREVGLESFIKYKMRMQNH